MQIDSVDVKILNALQNNARASLSTLAQAADLSVSAVSDRLKKLEKSGVISQYTTILNPGKMGGDLMAVILLQLDSINDIAEFLRFVREEPEILECHKITGVYDYMLKVVTANTASLEAFINRLKSGPSYKSSETNVVLSTSKQLYSVVPVATGKGKE